MKLPAPVHRGSMTVEEALLRRRSIREYSDEPLTLEEIAQLLWSAYGVTSPEGYRTAPSAMTLYPLSVYVLAHRVTDLEAGLYRYEARNHTIELQLPGFFREKLFGATFNQEAVARGAAVLVITANYSRPEATFGRDGRKFTLMDIGHLGQNVHLQAVALGIGTVVIAAIRPDEVRKLLELPEEEDPLYLMPLGK